MRKKNKGQLKGETGTGTSFPFSLLQGHMDSSCAQLFCHIQNTLGPKDDLCSCHPLKTPQSPVLNLHVHEWISDP